MNNTSLVLCRTPLQSVIVKEVLQRDSSIDFDLIYFTHHNSSKDRHCYSALAKHAKFSEYCYVERYAKEAVQHWFILKALPKVFKKRYKKIYLASFDNFLFRIICSRNTEAQLVTFDDGLANIMLSGSYHNYKASRGMPYYEFLFRVMPTPVFKKKIYRHFSIYPEFDNIVEPERLLFVAPWETKSATVLEKSNGSVSFFIGQPFDEVLDIGYFDRGRLQDVIGWFDNVDIDYYLQHPRETTPLQVGGRLVNDARVVAEESIFELSNGCRPKIYGWFSSVLFNVSSELADKVYLSVGDTDEEVERVKMAEKVGCLVIKI